MKYISLLCLLLGFTRLGVAQEDTWELVSALDSLYINALLTSESGSVFVGVRSYGVYRSHDQGLTWEQSSNGFENNTVTSLAKSAEGILYAEVGNNLYHSLDDGQTWENTHAWRSGNYGFWLSPWGDYFSFGSAISQHGNSMWRSTDEGQTWSHLFICNGGSLSTNCISGIGFGMEDELFLPLGHGALLHSRDNGDTFSEYDFPIEDDVSSWITSSSGAFVVAAEQSGIFRSEDNGTSWEAVNTGLTSLVVRDMVQLDDGRLFAATYDGVFQSTDHGTTWVKYGALSHISWSSMAVGSDGHLFIAELDGSFYRTKEGIISVAIEDLERRSSLALQPFPNPFAGQTTFQFELTHPGSVRLRIVNLLGQEVATLIDGFREIGTYAEVWHAAGVPSGIYVCQLEAGGQLVTKMLTLIQ